MHAQYIADQLNPREKNQSVKFIAEYSCKRNFKRCPREVNRPYINTSHNLLSQSARKTISGFFKYIHRQYFLVRDKGSL